jgi:hypothetical protein
MPLPGGGGPRQRPAPGVAQQVNLGAQPAPGAAECLAVDGRGRRGMDFLSFDPAPCVARGLRRSRHQRRQPLHRHVLGWRVPGSSRVSVGPDHSRVHADRPLRPGVAVTAGLQRRQDLLPGAIG